jgi:hypothetical protein
MENFTEILYICTVNDTRVHVYLMMWRDARVGRDRQQLTAFRK